MYRRYVPAGRARHLWRLINRPSYENPTGYWSFKRMMEASQEPAVLLESWRRLQPEFAESESYEANIEYRRDWFRTMELPEDPSAEYDLVSLQAPNTLCRENGVTLIHLAPPSFMNSPAYPRAVDRLIQRRLAIGDLPCSAAQLAPAQSRN